MDLVSLAYVSSARTPFTPDELIMLLEHSRRKNAAAGITGMLLYKDGNFLQVLEGERATVTALRDRIAADPRHQGMITLFVRPVARRDFGEWSMAFVDLDHGARRAELQAIPGYSDFLDAEFSVAGIGGRLEPLLESFRRAIR